MNRFCINWDRFKGRMDWTAHKQGYEEGVKSKDLKLEIITELRKTITDSMALKKIDTILAKEEKNDTSKKAK